MANSIFVQIASYRDPELVPTITDLLAKAKYPDLISFGICLQDTPEEIIRLRGVLPQQAKIIEVPWNESKGLCWARAAIQKLYNGEEWTLQLDSHHRFATGWDEQLIDMWHQTGSPKAILTAYAAPYDPKKDSTITDFGPPLKMVADSFTPSGTILFRPQAFSEEDFLKKKPIKARFVSGHFFFTKGLHCIEYKYDPNIYFAGDEISLSIRSYTLGWDLFHPHKNVVWHEYTREGRPKHWSDHIEGITEMAWHERDVISKKRLRKMLREEDNDSDITGYDIGTNRSHLDYEQYAGIIFHLRSLHPDAIAGKEPPVSFADKKNWMTEFGIDYNLCLEWKNDDVNQSNLLQFIYFGIEDNNGNVLYRYDADLNSDELSLRVLHKRIVVRSFTKPSKLVIWPYDKNIGWLKKIEYTLQV